MSIPSSACGGDSWHQQPVPMSMTGTASEDSMELGGSYEGGWRWRLVVRAVGPSASTIQMENVIPTDHATTEVPAGPYIAMLMDLRPS